MSKISERLEKIRIQSNYLLNDEAAKAFKFLLDYIDLQQAVVEAAREAALINTNIDISALREALAALDKERGVGSE